MTSRQARVRRYVPLVILLLMPQANDGRAQSFGQLSLEENFRAAPNGELLLRLEEGALVTIVDRRDGWLEVDLEGWVWTRSLQAVESGQYDLVVSEAEGENLRESPSGTIVGRLLTGTLLRALRREPGWILVRRRGWIWAASVDESPLQAPARPTAAPEGPATSRPPRFTDVGTNGAAILTAPDGDTLAQTPPTTQLEVLARQGNWARVRLEGWTWLPDAAGTSSGEVSGSPLTPDDLSLDPQAYVGRVVAWRLQFISLERAESVRTDFFEGEPFLLCRFGGSDGPFVYVTVPPERSGDILGLQPLEFLTVTARVRTGASTLTGTAIIDLLGLERERLAR